MIKDGNQQTHLLRLLIQKFKFQNMKFDFSSFVIEMIKDGYQQTALATIADVKV